MMGMGLLESKVGHLCHFVMTGCVSPPATLPQSSGGTDTDTGHQAVTSLTSPLALCVSVYVVCVHVSEPARVTPCCSLSWFFVGCICAHVLYILYDMVEQHRAKLVAH